MRVLCALCFSAALCCGQDRTAAEKLLQQGKPQEALSILLPLHKAQPDDWRVCHQIGIAYIRLERLDDAAGYFRKVLVSNPGFLPARKNLGTALWFLNQKQESEREFRLAAKAAPNDPVPQLYLGLAEHERKQWLAAKEHFEKAGELALKNPELRTVVLETYLAAAEAYDRRNQPQKAYEAYGKAVEIDPGSEEAYIAFASFASDHQNNEFALSVLNRGILAVPGSSKLLLLKGVTQALLGKQEEAEKTLLEASRADPKASVPLLAVGVSKLERGEYEEAAAAFHRASELAPRDFRAYYLYGTALRRTNDPSRREDVIAAFRKAGELNPKDPRPAASLGQALFEAGRLPEAAAELERSLKIDPENPTALYQLGLLYRDEGKTELSRKVLQKFEEVKFKKKEEGVAVQILRIVRDK